MKRNLILTVLAVLALILVATATAVVRPQHGGKSQKNHPNYIRGPICADRSTGLLRWILARQKCLSNETRLLIPRGERGKRGLSARGPAGLAGATGAAGAQGATGAVGTAGAKGDAGATGAQGVQGLPGEAGAQGVSGPTGATGPIGPAGKDGSGLGNATLKVCVSNGGTLQLDVNGQPCDNQGHQPITIVIVSNS